ncbi:MAG: hypothetical protein ACXVCP_03220 [Bdellovibrio sp.]
MAAAYIIGWIPSACVTGLQILTHRKKVRSTKYRQLQENLKKVNLVWREAHSELEAYETDKEFHDLKKFEKDIFLMGTFFFFLSWLGAFFNFVVFISIHFLALSNKERKIFSSELTERDLPVNNIEEILKDCQ